MLLIAPLCIGAAAQPLGPAGAPVPVTLAVDAAHPGAVVPPRFLGLSFEAAALGQLSPLGRRGDLVRLLRSVGPGIVRFGGVTADQNVGWSDESTPPPPWAASTIGPAQMQGLGVLTRRSGWQVLLTVGLAHFEPQAAAREVASAHRWLGSSLAAVEIGNEPDAYGHHGFRSLPWIAQGYQEDVFDYMEAIHALTPGIQLAGPDVTGSGVFAEWGGAEALAQRPILLTGHHYPLGCAQVPPPSIELLLQPHTREREARSFAAYRRIARAAGIPLRIDEAGSVSCGGVSGISNTFAAALWATGWLAQAMGAGAAGVNLEGNPLNCAGYTPLCATSPDLLRAGRFRAQPVWYALLLARELIGSRPLPVSLATAGSPDLAADAFAGPRGELRVVLVDDDPPGSSPVTVRLGLGGVRRSAGVLRLTGPAPDATDGVLLGGREVAADGSWHPPRPSPVPLRRGAVQLTLGASSAALLTLGPPAHGHR
jgi:hypothetical protein